MDTPRIFDAPIKRKVRMTYPGSSSVKKKLDFESTDAVIQSQDDDGEEVTSEYIPLKK